MAGSRQYDIVLFGATGYTGKLTAEYIAKSLPTNIKWAIAGRSSNKLEAVAANCREINSDRIQPVIEVCGLDDAELGDLARKTTIFVSTVGPYAIYGEHAFKACAENGTHYLDVTGEAPWVHKMIKKYEKSAKSSGAIMIPQIGVDSSPADLVTWSLVSFIRKKCSAPTADLVLSIHELRAAPSGGTLSTIFSIQEQFSLSELRATSKPYALSPIPGPKAVSSSPWYTKILGIRSVSDLGVLTSSLGTMSDTPIVQRSWGLYGGANFYGPNFHFQEFMKARNYLTGIAFHFALLAGVIALSLAPFRWLLRKLVYQPGDGPNIEDTKRDRAEYRAVAFPDTTDRSKKAHAKVAWEGGMYALTATFLGQACMTLLKDGDVLAKKLGAGIFTPATLGQAFIDRLAPEGFQIELKMIQS